MKYRVAAIIYITLLVLIELTLLVWLVYSFAVQKKPLDENTKPLILFIGYTLTLAKIFTGKSKTKQRLAYYADFYSKEIGDAFDKSKLNKTMLLKALKAYNDNNFNKSIKLLESLLRKSETVDDEFVCLTFMAKCYEESHRNNKAIECYDRLINLEPTNPQPYNNLGTLYSSIGEYTKAVDVLSLAIRYDYSYPFAYHNLSTAYLNLGEIELSLENSLKAYSLNNSNRLFINNLAILYGIMQDFENMNLYIQKSVSLGESKEKLLRAIEWYTQRNPQYITEDEELYD